MDDMEKQWTMFDAVELPKARAVMQAGYAVGAFCQAIRDLHRDVPDGMKWVRLYLGHAELHADAALLGAQGFLEVREAMREVRAGLWHFTRLMEFLFDLPCVDDDLYWAGLHSAKVME